MKYDKIIADLCISVLLEMDTSVVIGYKVDGNMQALRKHTAVYNTELNGIHRLKGGTRFDFPRGKFHVVLTPEDLRNGEIK